MSQAPDLATLADDVGTFSMLAIDQRESLRTLLAAAGHGASDEDLSAFKVAVGRALSPLASGILVDRDYGLAAMLAADAIAPGCGRIVAVDRLVQQPGGPLEWSELDRDAMTSDLVGAGARALKFLVIWRPDDEPGPRQVMVHDFVEGCRRLGVLAVLEGLVQIPGVTAGPALDAAILGAAEEFAAFAPDLYKTHVPTLGAGDDATIIRQSVAVSAAIRRPWVVLSAGVAVERFPSAVAAACAGGASGFLAGRGVWGPSIAAADRDADLRTAAHRRLVELVEIARTSARPWWEATLGPT